MPATPARPPSRAKLLLGLVSILWIAETVDLVLLGGGLDGLGIRPRSTGGLWGLLLAPFLHGGFGHLAANTLPLLVFAALLLVRGLRDFVVASLLITVLGGLGVWLVGASGTVHIGASGLIFGYLGFLLVAGFLDRSFTGILVSVGVGAAYGGMLWGVLPQQPGVSWEGHLFGFLAGLFAAKVVCGRR